jgi:DNA-binding MarR family transcriptional regulator
MPWPGRSSHSTATAPGNGVSKCRADIPLDIIRLHDYRAHVMASVVARELKQKRAFTSREQEVLLGLQILAARIMEPWEKYLKSTAALTLHQYNVLRILRGSHPTALPSGEIATRMISRDPDITRLVDRLEKRGLVKRVRGLKDRRVVEVGITHKGLEILHALDEPVDRFPRVMLGYLGPKKLEQLQGLLEQALSDVRPFP